MVLRLVTGLMTTTDARDMVKADGVIPNVGGSTTNTGNTGTTTNPAPALTMLLA